MKRLFSFKNLSIGKKFTVSFILFLMLPLLVLFLWINSSVKDRITRESYKTNLAVLKQTETSVNDLIENLTYVSLQVIANEELQELLTVADISDDRKEELARQIRYDLGALLNSKEYISSLSVYSDDEILFQLGKYLLDEPQKYKKEAEAEGGQILWIAADICDSYAFQKDRTFENAIYRAINSHDNYRQKLAFERISVQEDYLYSLYSGIWGNSTESIFIVNGDGIVVSCNDKAMLGKSLVSEQYFSDIVRMKEGYLQLNRNNLIASFYYIPEPDWYVVKLDDKAELTGLRQPDAVIIACILCALFFGVMFYNLQRKRIIHPLIELAGDVGNFHEGNYEIGTYSESPDEIGRLNNQFVSMSRYIQDLIEKVYKSQLREKEAQLKYLQSQINPHFLYNTLDSMRWMAVKQKQYDLAEQIEALSNLFKHALNEGKEYTTVEKEIRHLEDYLTIQKNRFGNRFRTRISVEKGNESCVVLNLILQPLVENAIVHGIEKKLGEGMIQIDIRREDNDLLYIVEDNGLGTDEDEIRHRLSERKDTHNALALDNINQRLKCTYGDQYGIWFESEIGKGTKVTARMPVEREEEK